MIGTAVPGLFIASPPMALVAATAGGDGPGNRIVEPDHRLFDLGYVTALALYDCLATPGRRSGCARRGRWITA